MAATDQIVAIDEPCVIYDLPELDYHADPVAAGSLSSTEAKLILDCPAVLKWRRAHGEPPKDSYDFGHVVHGLVLGAGMPVEVIPEEILSTTGAATTKEAKDFKAAARAEGKIPIKQDEYDRAVACAAAATNAPGLSKIFANGRPEVSVFAPDPDTGVWMRGRIDWVTTIVGKTILVDVKTTPSANPAEFSRQAARYDYALQREWYRAIWAATHDGTLPDFVHIVVSKTEPYLACIVDMDESYAAVGQAKMRRALAVYAECQATGQWPGYNTRVHTISPPAYYTAYEED
ncbi:MAG: PD-(D/E)XK nuclease-like domain-containing protein [Actinomycetaceae bacterium]|nr:PD-(D/E)XK nuclease-like domain-containing protein [Actinomycetaceae bacterium]